MFQQKDLSDVFQNLISLSAKQRPREGLELPFLQAPQSGIILLLVYRQTLAMLFYN